MSLRDIYIRKDVILREIQKKYSISIKDLREILENFSKDMRLSWVIPDKFNMEHCVENWFIFSRTLLNYLLESFFHKKFNFGREVEFAGIKFLSNLGLDIVVANYKTKRGEIDIVCKEKETFRFVEVKGSIVFRSEEQINRRKINKIVKVSEDFTNEVVCQEVGYDALLFDGKSFKYYRDYLI